MEEAVEIERPVAPVDELATRAVQEAETQPGEGVQHAGNERTAAETRKRTTPCMDHQDNCTISSLSEATRALGVRNEMHYTEAKKVDEMKVNEGQMAVFQLFILAAAPFFT